MNIENGLIPSQHDNHSIPQKWNDTQKNYPLEHCLHELIEKQVERNPDAEAVCFEGVNLCYSELNERSNRCGHYLREMGIGPGKIVGVLMERSIEMIVSLLGILKSGGFYLPLDPHYPKERLNLILEDTQVSILLTQSQFKDRLNEFDGTTLDLDENWSYLAKEPKTNLENLSGPNDLAYLIYTSGSTGKPNGCMISHKAICNRLLWMQDQYSLTEKDRILQKTPFTFDVSLWEIFWPLISGACMVIAKPNGHKDSDYLVQKIREDHITTCHFVPSMLRFFLKHQNVGLCLSLRHVFTSGEVLAFDLMMKFKKNLSAKLHNLYGPTEAAVDVTYWECEEREDKKVPIGRPIANIQTFILDDGLRSVELGQKGELYIGGTGLAKGYLNQPELTSKKFINNPLPGYGGAKLYKTGDKARYLADGNIEFLGRKDFQVKLRGLRIELGEIELALKDHTAISEAVVLVRDEEKADPKLVAYISSVEDVPSSKQLRKFLSSKLPETMVPNIFVPIFSLPVTAHGKLDRDALPWPVKRREKKLKKGDKRRSKGITSKKLLGVLNTCFEKVLDISEIKADDDLFDLGATSLTMVQIVDQIDKLYGIHVPVEVFLDDPTLRAIARYLGKELGVTLDDAGDDQPPFIVDETIQLGETVIRKAENSMKLAEVRFKKIFYFNHLITRKFSGESIPFTIFSQFLSLLKAANVEGETKYLHPSSGGLNAIQTYLYIKKDGVDSIQDGIFYYHPEEHGLYPIILKPNIDQSIFL